MTAITKSPLDPLTIERPDPALKTYYIIVSILSGPFVVVTFLPLMFRYYTLRYRFDDAGIWMSWGVVFKREIYLTYRRIQDIHVTRNLVHRWLDLSAVAIQTASGSTGLEMTIEGIRRPESLRDFLYQKMRGTKGDTGITSQSESAPEDEALILLRQIRDDLADLRQRSTAKS